MALCEFSKLVGGSCSGSTDYSSNVACVSLEECDSGRKRTSVVLHNQR